jgi:hypothetical protein
VTPFTDPGDQRKGKSRLPNVRGPLPPSLFDTTNQPPETPARVKSGTSIDSAKDAREGAMSERRQSILKAVRGSVPGLARFQIAERLAIPDHWVTSSVDALITMGKLEESKTLTVVNPKSGKTCAVLVALDSDEDAAA